jgi:RHS repeat-associated protein
VPLPEWNFNWYEGVDMGDASFEGHWIPGGSRFKNLVGKTLTPQNFFGKLTKLYANSLDWNLSANASLSGNFGASFTWSQCLGWFGFLNFTASAGAGVNAGESASGITVKMMDIDGDGYVDHVIRFPKGSKNEGVWYKKNLFARSQLLRKIKLPGGGECRIDYVEDKGTPQMPGSRYVMSKVTMADCCGKDGKALFNHGEHETTVEYSYAGGYFDRAVKESYGYESVTAEYEDSSKKILLFFNDSYYNKGMKKSESVTVKGMDGKDALISHVEYELEDNVPLVKKRTEVQLDEASGVQSAENIPYAESTGQAVKRTVEYEYDDFGNVTKITESGSADSKTLEAEIEYFANSSKYIYSKPSLIEVKEEGKLLRKRSGLYDGNGSLTKLSQFYMQNEHTDISYTYDSYGNIKTVTGSNGDVTEYKYDSTHNQYIEEISSSADGVTYKSTAEWNKKFGKPAVTKDINGNSMKYTYDSWGRTVSVATDYDGDIPAVRYKYYGMKKTDGQGDAKSLWYTVTENKVTFDKEDSSVIKTLIASDGLGRTALTAKTGVVRGEEGFNLSGQIEYDKKGRVIKQGKPYFMAGSLDMSDEILADTVINYAASQEIKNPDVTEYDGVDRVVSTVLSDGSLIKNEYSVEEGFVMQKTFDPDTEAAGTSGNFTVSKKDFRGNIVKLEKFDKAGFLLTKTAYEYDALSQLKTALDAENNPVVVEHDLLGRKTSLTSKDSGTKEWFYNAKGNLEKERDSVLKAKNEYIEYSYDGFGRNTRIGYPQSLATEIEYGTCEDSETNSAGKVKKITDASGVRELEYGLLGEVKKETRSIKHIKNYLTSEETAVMEYKSDYLGRMQEITYPDGEVLTYSYDKGGQVTGVSGRVYGLDLTYVKDIQYDEYGQRTRIEYGNGAVTDYAYDEHRRWLSALHTDSRLGETLQNLKYSFDRVGNVLGYTNDCLGEVGNYTTAQNYTYDGLYQLTSATGESVYNPHRGGVPDYKTTYSQSFSFDANGLGKMLSKTSSMTVSQGKALGGDGLVYDLDYEYDGNFVHRLKRAGDRTYTYDDCGRLLEEKEGETENSTDTVRLSRTVKKEKENVYSQDYGWGLSNEATREAQKADAAINGTGSGSTSGAGNTTGSDSSSGFRRTYTWDEKGRLTATSDSNYDVEYVYGEDNQRAVKTSDMGETLYFNNFWVWSNNSAVYNGSRTAKHIFLNSERIVTKLNSASNPTYSEESASTYYYHSDHLGSASVISDNDGREYERIEYTPYGEVWIDKASATYKTAYRFTGKERDEETGLYYFGERYLDAKVSRWLSCDPALSDFVAGQSNGMSGGIFNSVNMNLYHYAGNNPVIATDPDGRELYVESDDSAYRQRVKEDIQKLAPNAVMDDTGKVTLEGDTVKGYEKGTELIKRLVDDKRKVIIKMGSKNECIPQVTNPVTGEKLSDAQLSYYMNGTGNKASADVIYNFNLPEKIKREDGSDWSRPGYLGLCHELIHAKHSVSGTISPSLDLEEKQTVIETDIIINSLIKAGVPHITERGKY